MSKNFRILIPELDNAAIRHAPPGKISVATQSPLLPRRECLEGNATQENNVIDICHKLPAAQDDLEIVVVDEEPTEQEQASEPTYTVIKETPKVDPVLWSIQSYQVISTYGLPQPICY